MTSLIVPPRRRPKFAPSEYEKLALYLAYKRQQATKAIETLEIAKVVDTTKFSQANLTHWERVRGTIDWLLSGMGASTGG